MSTLFYCYVSFSLLAAVHTFVVSVGVPIIQTKYGEIHGQLVTVNYEGKNVEIRKFLGIPYAKAPVGDRRFRKPEMMNALPVTPFMATNFGPICPQPNVAMFGLTTSEDCLFLNIYAPMMSSSTVLKPVMVYIHGGGFDLGFSDIYDGSIIGAYADVIVVAMNYRIGPLGFLSTKDAEAPGNFGLWDQRLAIEWVSENIAAFGGDRSKITIFGESAGGSSVIYQTVYPGNDGLFQRAIAQSGTIAAWGVNRFDSNYKVSTAFAKYAGCNYVSSSLLLQCLRNKSSDHMKTVTESFQSFLPVNLVNNTWVPVFDGDFVVTKPDQLLNEMADPSVNSKYPAFKNVDLMIGANKLDGNVFITNFLEYINESSYGPLTDYFNVTSDQFEHIIMPIAAAISLGEIPNKAVLEAIRFEYTAWDDRNNLTRRLQNLINIATDLSLNAPSVSTARAHANGNTSTFMYQFSTAYVMEFLPIPPMLKDEQSAGHADELGFVFGFPAALLLPFGANPANVTAKQHKVSKATMAMWSNFAKTG
jgi:carboxylesterase type B